MMMRSNTTENKDLDRETGQKGEKRFEQQLLKTRKESLENIKNQMDTLDKEIQKTERLRAHFLSNVSHEIKTPLNSILTATLLLQQKQLDTESTELVNTIHHSGQYLFSLLNDVLDYYKMAAHQLSLDHIHFDVKNELNEVIKIFEEKASKKEISFETEINDNLPDTLTGDATRLKQILTNLLDNALKFTPAGGRVRLTAQPVSHRYGKHELRFAVHDTGIGIKEEDRNEIWEKFSMADMSLTRTGQGTGLGLPLSRQLCHLLGGEIHMESEPGKGSTFSFTVRMDDGPSKPTEKAGSAIRNILLVEDNLINQKLTQKILLRQGFQVDVADNGQMAVEKFRNNRYDLIFMDIQMPVMDGLEATRRIRQVERERGAAKKVKIIALTANSQQQDKEKCLAAGMDDYINKPFNINKFPLILNNYR